VINYIHAYMKFWHLYEEEDGHDDVVYRYDWLIGEDGDNNNSNIQILQDRVIQFVIQKKKEGLGSNGLDNYINPLRRFYRVNGMKGIDWEVVREYRPDRVKKTHDREYYADEVIAIEEKLDVRGKVASGLMRGSGVRRGAEPSINVGDLIPLQTKYGKIYKIWVYRGAREMYATACIPEVAKRIDDYFEYRMRFGKICKQFGKTDHKHEYYDGYDGNEVIEKWYKADEPHLDPDAPLIREDFDRTDSFSAKFPKRLSDDQITDIIREAAIAAGIRKVNKGQPFKRHRVMLTHGFRKLFKKRCRQAKVDPIILERLLGHNSGNSADGVTKLMMTYDPEDWTEMQAEFEKAIPQLTITKEALIQAQLEETKTQLENIPTTEDREQIKIELEQMRQSHLQTVEQLATVTAKLEEMSQKHAEALGVLPMMNPRDAIKIASKLLKGLPGQRAYEERERERRAENILYGD
jgi:site-specific recombinase XerC